MKLFLATTLALASSTSAWTYGSNNGADWPTSSKVHCGGKRQSPIDIKTADAVAKGKDQYDAANRAYTAFTNAGAALSRPCSLNNVTDSGTHSITYSFTNEIASGDLKCPQFHYHFKSEHAMNGKLFDGEFHIVCYQNKFADIGKALEDGSGDVLRVFGFMVEHDAKAADNAHIAEFINHKKANAATSVTLPVPSDVKQSKYWTYEGSLTTPTCNEVVQWTVFEKSVKISTAQLNEINTWAKGNLIGNNRVTMPLNKREVRMFHNGCADTTKRSVCSAAQTVYDTACKDATTCKAAHIVFKAAVKAIDCECSGSTGLLASLAVMIVAMLM